MIAGGRYKYVADHARGRESVHDLESDPHEQRDLATARPELTAALRDVFRGWRSGQLAYYHYAHYYRAYYPPAYFGEGPAVER